MSARRNQNEPEIREIVHATLRWVRIWKRYARYQNTMYRAPTDADADHSALLNRLINGEEPFKEVPPLRGAYPDYGAMEGKELDTRLGTPMEQDTPNEHLPFPRRG